MPDAAIRQNAPVAVVVAVVVLLTAFAQRVLSSFLTAFTLLAQGDTARSTFPMAALGAAIVAVPFAVGVLLVLWLLRPVTADTNPVAVLGRSVLAALGGMVLCLLVGLVEAAFVRVNLSSAMVGGWGAAAFDSFASLAGLTVLYELQWAVQTGIALVPATALAGLLGWLWARSRVTAEV